MLSTKVYPLQTWQEIMERSLLHKICKPYGNRVCSQWFKYFIRRWRSTLVWHYKSYVFILNIPRLGHFVDQNMPSFNTNIGIITPYRVSKMDKHCSANDLLHVRGKIINSPNHGLMSNSPLGRHLIECWAHASINIFFQKNAVQIII